MNEQPWVKAKSAVPYVSYDVARRRAARAERERVQHAARWGAGVLLDLAPEEVVEQTKARHKARNKRKHAAAPVQKLGLYDVSTAVRPLRDRYLRGEKVPRAPRLPSKKAIRVIFCRVVTAYDLAKYGAQPSHIKAATQAEAERVAIERCYREECAKARAAMNEARRAA